MADGVWCRWKPDTIADMNHRPANVDLLATEIGIIWGLDSRGREEPPSLVLGDAGSTNVVHARKDLPAEVADRIRGIVVENGLPKAARLVQQLLTEAIGEVEETVGPSYDCANPAPQSLPLRGRLLTSDAAERAELDRVHNPGTWDAEEWQRLLDGDVGPWAMVIEDGRMLSVCHSARVAPAGLEAGIWTDPDARGQGLAAVCTEAWALVCHDLPGEIFFSTDAYNIASQRVAARLKLPPIGQLWKFRLDGEDVPPTDAELVRIPSRRIDPDDTWIIT